MKKIIAIFLAVAILSVSTFSAPKVNAYLGVLDFSSDIPTTATTGMTASGVFSKLGQDIAAYVRANTAKIILVASKMAALLAVQKITQAIIGDGGGGVITDWNNYLYVSPQQRAMAQMNSFFNTVSRGRLSSLNYEGVGPNYDAYLVAQARQAIAGQPFSTNLQEIVTDPSQVFAGGNMKGLMTYMQCANNIACYTLTSTAQYNLELAKATEIAKLGQDRGFLPVKKNGKIIQPAAIVSSALIQIDQLGTQVIMNADAKTAEELTGAEMQVAAGAGINIAARSFNYMLADSAGKAAIRNKNDEFPFSASYSLNGGLGLSAGGVSVNTGVGAWTGFLQIGNTCAAGGFEVDARGVAVLVQGQKRQCPYPSANSSVTLPTITCTAGIIGDQACAVYGSFKCGAAGKCIAK